MFNVRRWIRNVSCVGCLYGALVGSFLPARAQFIPDKGVTVQHLKGPKDGQGFGSYYWLSDHELVSIQRTTGPDEQYCKLDLTTGKEQALVEFTKIVRETIEAKRSLPSIFPSPDRKYLAWVECHDHEEDTLVVGTIDGSIISRKPGKVRIHYPSWSADSQWCFAFLEGRAPDGILPGQDRRVFDAITAVSIKTPSVLKTYPIALKPESRLNALSGYKAFS
ncbi:MAG: hypothetical protein JWN14_4937, partial [Chthonomonadales bacterium]|nr:hypothetical protein [Chthonomonadales bacterium]